MYYVYKMARTQMDENTEIIKYSTGNEKGRFYGVDNNNLLVMLIPALFVGLPLDAVEIVTFIRIFTRGEWLPFVIAFAVTLTFGIIYGLVTVPYYYKHVGLRWCAYGSHR